MTNLSPELVIIGHGSAVSSLAFSADGKTLVSGSYDKTAILWDVDTGTMRRLLRLDDYNNGIAITPDGSVVVTDDGQVWDAQTGKSKRRSNRYTAPLACSPDGRTLACAAFVPDRDDYFVLLTDIRTGRTRFLFPCSEHQPESLAFSSDGELVAATGYESQEEEEEDPYITTVYNLRTGETRRVLKGQDVRLFGAPTEPNVRLVAVSPDGSQLWNAETGEALKTVVEHVWYCSPFDMRSVSPLDTLCVSVSADGRLLGVGTTRGEISVWDIAACRRLWHTEAHRSWLRTMAFTADGQMLATGGDDHTIRLWDAWTGAHHRTLGECGVSVEAVAFTPDGASLTAIAKDKKAHLWSIQSACCERQEETPFGILAHEVAVKPDIARNLWRIDPATLPTKAEVPGSISIAAISPDGSLVALYTDDAIAIWNRDQRKVVCTLPVNRHNGWVAPVFSLDNRLLATGSEEGTVMRLFDTQSGQIWREWTTGESCEFAFSQDGSLLAIGHYGFSVTLWSVQTGEQQGRFRIDGDCINALAFSPDGKPLAVGTAYEETAWLRTQGKKEVRLVGHTGAMRSVDYAPDGTLVATGAADGTVRLWDSPKGKLRATFRALPGGEWIIYTPEGYYNGSQGAEQFILWRVGEDLVPAERFAEVFRDPDKIKSLATG